MKTTAVAALILCTGILLGAFGAHGLDGKVSADRIETWNTAALYHLVNGLGLLMLGIWRRFETESVPLGVIRLLVFGITIFAGSLYTLVLLDLAILGAITPIGGLALSIAWAWLGIHLFKQQKNPISG